MEAYRPNPLPSRQRPTTTQPPPPTYLQTDHDWERLHTRSPHTETAIQAACTARFPAEPISSLQTPPRLVRSATAIQALESSSCSTPEQQVHSGWRDVASPMLSPFSSLPPALTPARAGPPAELPRASPGIAMATPQRRRTWRDGERGIDNAGLPGTPRAAGPASSLAQPWTPPAHPNMPRGFYEELEQDDMLDDSGPCETQAEQPSAPSAGYFSTDLSPIASADVLDCSAQSDTVSLNMSTELLEAYHRAGTRSPSLSGTDDSMLHSMAERQRPARPASASQSSAHPGQATSLDSSVLCDDSSRTPPTRSSGSFPSQAQLDPVRQTLDFNDMDGAEQARSQPSGSFSMSTSSLSSGLELPSTLPMAQHATSGMSTPVPAQRSVCCACGQPWPANRTPAPEPARTAPTSRVRFQDVAGSPTAHLASPPCWPSAARPQRAAVSHSSTSAAATPIMSSPAAAGPVAYGAHLATPALLTPEAQPGMHTRCAPPASELRMSHLDVPASEYSSVSGASRRSSSSSPEGSYMDRSFTTQPAAPSLHAASSRQHTAAGFAARSSPAPFYHATKFNQASPRACVARASWNRYDSSPQSKPKATCFVASGSGSPLAGHRAQHDPLPGHSWADLSAHTSSSRSPLGNVVAWLPPHKFTASAVLEARKLGVQGMAALAYARAVRSRHVGWVHAGDPVLP